MNLTTVPEYLSALDRNAGSIEQPDTRTCQATCIFAVTGGNTSIGNIYEDLHRQGVPGDPAVMAEYLREHYCDRYRLHMDASVNDIREWIRSGAVIITHGWFTDSGHVLILDGATDTGFRVMDPWAEFDGPSWEYPENPDRAFSGVYSDILIYAACIASFNADDAHDIYLNGVVNRSVKGAWVHVITPGVG